jgi:hypothetical protein
MRKFVVHKMFILSITLLCGKGFGQVKSDFDKSTDFTQYKTYYFEGWQENSDKQLNDFDKRRILDSFKAEFDSRGLTPVTDQSQADAAVALYLVLDNKTSTTAYTDYMGGMGYGPRWGWGMGGMGMGTATTTYSEDDYIEGTLVVDMYDAAEKKLVWQGILTTVVKDNPKKREKTIPKKIHKLMREFPVDPSK